MPFGKIANARDVGGHVRTTEYQDEQPGHLEADPSVRASGLNYGKNKTFSDRRISCSQPSMWSWATQVDCAAAGLKHFPRDETWSLFGVRLVEKMHEAPWAAGGFGWISNTNNTEEDFSNQGTGL